MTQEQLERLKALFKEKLLPVANELEPLRLALLPKPMNPIKAKFIISLIFFGITAVPTGVITWTLTHSFAQSGTAIVISALTWMIVVFSLMTGKSKFPVAFDRSFGRRSKYLVEFKNRIIRPIGEIFCDELRYERTGAVDRQYLEKSGLIDLRKGLEYYGGEDHFSGKIGEIEFEFSEVSAATTAKNSNGQEIRVPLFEGIVFVARFNKAISGKVLILPDYSEWIFGQAGRSMQRLASGEVLVELEDPEFEKCFKVIANDQIEARYILSSGFMKRVLSFYDASGLDLRISIAGDVLCLAASSDEKHFELFSSEMLTFEHVLKHAREFERLLDVVAELNLNRRIWRRAG